MFKPVPMKLVRVIGLRKDMPDVVKLLHDLGTVQLRKIKDARLGPEKPLEAYSSIAEQLVRMRAVENVLEPQPVDGVVKELSLDEVLREAQKVSIDKRLAEIAKRREDIRAEMAELKEAAKIMAELEDMRLDLAILKSTAFGTFIGRISTDKMKEVERAVRAVTTRYALRYKKINKFESVLVLIVDAKFKEPVAQMLERMGFAEVRLSQISGEPAHISLKLRERMTALSEETAALAREVGELSRKYYAKVVRLREMLEIYLERAQAPQNFGRTLHTFVLEGWLPEERLPEARDALLRRFGKSALLEVMETEETPPTMLKNPGIFAPFEFMVSFVSLPKGREIDPTILFALIFPIFYGMMLGDFGYGLVSMLLAYLLLRRFRGTMLEPVAKVWMIAAIPAMFFGVLYDEYFGFRHEHLLGFQLYHAYPRMENINLFLLVMIILGAFHVAIGFLLGAYNRFSERHWMHGLAKLAWIMVEFSGIALIATIMFRAFPEAVVMPAAVAGAVALLIILKAEGFIGIIELPGLASNIFSYARILAVGIASIVVAELINELLLPAPEKGLFALALAPVFLVLHLFNIVLGMFESLVQGARLNYVEFFSKFYEGGGLPFNPFRYVRRFTA